MIYDLRKIIPQTYKYKCTDTTILDKLTWEQ